MIRGYVVHGYGKNALKLFHLMKKLGINPNSITFVCVLFVCSHAGLVDEGCKYFNNMSDLLHYSWDEIIHALLTFLVMQDILRKI